MRAVIQRVKEASVEIDGAVRAKIGAGLLVLFCVETGDSTADLDYMEKKLLGLRIFSDNDGKMNLSVTDIGGEILFVSQFTLAGDARKGMRPSYSGAARPETAIPMYEEMIKRLSKRVKVACGEFGADMLVSLQNDGPVTILLDSKRAF